MLCFIRHPNDFYTNKCIVLYNEDAYINNHLLSLHTVVLVSLCRSIKSVDDEVAE